jgi:hypothetical protein
VSVPGLGLFVLDSKYAAALGLGESIPVEEFWCDIEASYDVS